MNEDHHSTYAGKPRGIDIACGPDLRLCRVVDDPGRGHRQNFAPKLAILILVMHGGAVFVELGDGEKAAVAESSSTWFINLERGASLVRVQGAAYTALEVTFSSLECLAIGCGFRITSFPSASDQPLDPVLESSINALCAHVFAASSESLSNADFCRAMGTAIQYHILRTYTDRSAIKGDTPGTLAPWQLHAVKQAILSRLDTRVCAAELARMCGISTSHLRRAFFASTGESLHRWSMRRRIDHACNDLVTTSSPVAEIALRWGFSDQSHLTRTFAAMLGVTPAKWREAHSPAKALKLVKPECSRFGPFATRDDDAHEGRGFRRSLGTSGVSAATSAT